MESTWETRDLPVLDAIVTAFDEDPARLDLSPEDIADLTGKDSTTVLAAVRALHGKYLKTKSVSAEEGLLISIFVLDVTDDARRAVGQWPSPDAWADRIVKALREAAEEEPDEAKRSRLRLAADALGGFGRDVLVGVLSGGITTAMG